LLFLTIQKSSEALKSYDFSVQLSEFVSELLLRILRSSSGLVELLVVENPGGAQQELPDELMRLRGEVCRHLELFVPDAIAQCPDGDPFDCQLYQETTCGTYGVPRAYVVVEVEEPYEPLSGISLLPSVTVKRKAYMRVR